MKRRIVALIASLAVITGLMSSRDSGAWFITAVKRAQDISIAVINFDSEEEILGTVEEDYYGRPCIYPGQNLVLLNNKNATLTMINNSSIDTQIRVRIEYTSFSSGVKSTEVYSADKDEDLQVEFANPGEWLPCKSASGEVCFYYVGPGYGSKVLSDPDNACSITPDVSNIDIIKSILYKNDIDTASYSGNEVTVDVIFEAKQADYVGWSALADYQINSDINN